MPELLVEFYEDYYSEHPDEARRVFNKADGQFYFEETGDELLDKWERELEQGLTPDLEEGLSQSAKERLQKEREKRKKSPVPQQSKAPVPPSDPRLASKYAAHGSREEQELLRKKLLGSGIPSTDWVDILGRE